MTRGSLPFADLVLRGGRVLTMDARSSVVPAVAVRDGLVVAVGHDDLAQLVGPATQVVELGGRTVLPGINDAHCHALAFGLDRPPFNLDLTYPTVRSVGDVVAAVGEAARQRPAGAWIVGSGWDPGFLDELVADPGRRPSRHDLDTVSPEHPVYLQDFSYHTA